jgi:hypothetical protein
VILLFLHDLGGNGVSQCRHDEAANYSFVLRGYVPHWLANVRREYDGIKLIDIVGSTKLGPEQKGEKIVALKT